jgi:hypothetical protein
VQDLFLYKPEFDTRRAMWAVERCTRSGAETLQTVVPSGFTSYVRLCQPGWFWPAIDPGDNKTWADLAAGLVDHKKSTPVRWCDTAEKNGHIVHRLMQWHAITPPIPKPGDAGISAPLEGDITVEMVEILFDVLIRHSGEDQECICAFWEGHGTHDHFKRARNTRVEGIGQQSYFLFNASLAAVRDQWWVALKHRWETGGLAPNALWPESQDWYYAVPFERSSSYFGGPAGLVTDIREAPGLETYEAFLDDNIWRDEINALSV